MPNQLPPEKKNGINRLINIGPEEIISPIKNKTPPVNSSLPRAASLNESASYSLLPKPAIRAECIIAPP
jgi:hypothetical protein